MDLATEIASLNTTVALLKSQYWHMVFPDGIPEVPPECCPSLSTLCCDNT